MIIKHHQFDVCRYYANEKEVGEAVRQSGLKRSEVFITTKILSAAGSVDKTYQKLIESVNKIDGEDGYVDLFLIHTASGGSKNRKEIYQALEKLLESGKTKSIGVSNVRPISPNYAYPVRASEQRAFSKAFL
jgi:diketogulonate reductase-like aldo/keto reductase